MEERLASIHQIHNELNFFMEEYKREQNQNAEKLKNIESLKKNETRKHLLQLSEDLKMQQFAMSEFLTRVEQKQNLIPPPPRNGCSLSYLIKDVLDKMDRQQTELQAQLELLPCDEASLQEEAELVASFEKIRTQFKELSATTNAGNNV